MEASERERSVLALSALFNVSLVRRRSSPPFGRDGLGVSFGRSTGRNGAVHCALLDGIGICSSCGGGCVSCRHAGSFLFFGLALFFFGCLALFFFRRSCLRGFALGAGLGIFLGAAFSLFGCALGIFHFAELGFFQCPCPCVQFASRQFADIIGDRSFFRLGRFDHYFFWRWRSNRFCFWCKYRLLFAGLYDAPFLRFHHNGIAPTMGKALPYRAWGAGLQ